MFNLDPDHLPQEIATLLLTRGRTVPPLLWDAQPNQLAARTLGEIDDTKLFQRMGLANTAMASAVRALLLLWNGLPAQAKMALQSAPEAEQNYIATIIARHSGAVEEAKELMRRVGAHGVHQSLTSSGPKLLAGARDLTLARLAGILRQGGQWEPFLFLDAFEQARIGKMKDSGIQVVCKLQCLEFELLLRHCCETALGEKLAKRRGPDVQEAPDARLQQMRQLVEKHRAARDQRRQWRDEHEPDEEETPDAPTQEERIKIACPKCKNAVDLPASARGQVAKCDRCATAFMVPPGKAAGALSPNVPSNLIGIRCPKCHEMLMFPEAVRGKRERCSKCGVVFLVPQKKPAATAAAETAGA